MSDIRDSKKYVIRKMADGSCWMAENLDFSLSAGTRLTKDNTDISSDWTILAVEASETAVSKKWGTGSNWGDTSQITDGEINTVHSFNGVSSETTTSYGGETQKIGVYYNWYTATAKSGTASSGAGVVAPYSICPRGFKLPDNSGEKSFANLINLKYGLVSDSEPSSYIIGRWPLSYMPSGNYTWYVPAPSPRGTHGYYWSSTSQSRTNAHGMGAYTVPQQNIFIISSQNNYVKAAGISVRCVSR